MRDKRIGRHVLVWSGMLLTAFVLVTGCTRITGKRTANPASAGAPDGETVLRGVVVQNDTQNRQLTLRELDSDIETILRYDATAEMTDQYGSERDGEAVELGEILEATYSAYSGKIISTLIPDDVWEYQEVKKYSFNSDERSMELADRKYQYSGTTYFSSSGKAIEMMELNQQDVLTVRGSGYTVYSVVRTEGHGYLRLSHYDDFVGGMIEVGNQLILPITKNMLITVREGTYKVILSKGNAMAVKNVTIRTDEEVTLDFSDYEPEDKQIGTITFQIEPAGADLTINGTAVDYRKPIVLAYGTYRLSVTMTGYTSYSGMLDVEQPKSTVSVNLVEEKTGVTETTEEPEVETTEDTSSSTEKQQTKEMDSDHTITVSAPEGAEVYLDNVYKGLVPCSFTKIIGSQTITLRKEGYTTKSYSVDILDDDEDVTLSFSELVAAASATAAASPTAAAGTASTE